MKITKRDYEQLKNKLDAIEKFLNAGKNNGGGNPYHDELGKITTGPDTAFGEYKYNPSDPGSVETSPESLGFKPKVESGDSPEYVVDLDDADQERVKKALADAGIEGEDAQIAMDSKISDLEDAIGSDLVRSLQEPKGSVVVESVLPAETVEALIDTTFSMQNLAIDDNEPIGTSAIAERLRESFWGLSSRLTSYGKNIQMLAQWSGASDKTSQELTAGAKKEIEATLSQCDKMVKAMSGTAGNKELEEYFEKKLSAAKAGYNTLKYIEENIDPDAPKTKVDVGSHLTTKETKERNRVRENNDSSNGGGNPYHDSLGRFCEGPSKAFGKYNPSDAETFVMITDGGDKTGLKENVDVDIKNGCTVGTTLDAKGVDALARTSLAISNIVRDGIHWDEYFKKADGSPEIQGMATLANQVGRNMSDARRELEGYLRNIGEDSQSNATAEDLSRVHDRDVWRSGAERSLEIAQKRLNGLGKKMKGVGREYVDKVLQPQVDTLKAALNTLDYVNKHIADKAYTDVYIRDPDAPKLNSLARATSEISDSLDRIIRLAKVKRLEKAIEKLENGGKGSGNFGHSGRPGKVGGSGKSSAGSLAQGRMIKGVRETDFKQGIDGGFTVELSSGKPYRLGKSEGYAVGGFGTEKVVDMKDWNDKSKRRKILNDYLKENKKALSQEGACLGGWVPTSGDDKSIIGKVVLDVSRVYKDKKEAAKAAIKTDQDSITDFKGFSWPTKQELAKEFGLEKELKKASGKRQAERNK